ncbi:hypothetical protein EUX98_g6009 [Antrodiella citrinella]|uniref:EF-hand domain-containing protein n=1 Tax=Antrodiella citrinella TaxID=2447956 RepID=A0A4S4MR26_9APHY|nr:hypothetical protein EUX98_g6009 [Antrodiella citrinella]
MPSKQQKQQQYNGHGDANDHGRAADFITSIPEVPVTRERPIWSHKNVKEAGVARANAAVTETSPHGTIEGHYTAKHSHQTVLQQHIDFFDLNHDGVITPLETYLAFRSLKYNPLFAILSALFIHLGLSYATLDPSSFLPDPIFRIFTRNIHRAKHGSDTGTYDNEGRFRSQMLHDLFTKHGERKDDGEWGLTLRQAMNAIMAHRSFLDLFGITAAVFEWLATYFVIWPEDGIMTLEDVRGVYDGSYFYKVAGRVPEIVVKHD